MKFQTALVGITLLFAAQGVAGAAVPAVEAGAAVAAVPAKSAVSRPFPGGNGCTAQGTGNCNFSLQGFAPNNDSRYATMLQAVIYNWRCDIIGGLDTGSGHFLYERWYSLSSQLPYTVDFHLYENIGNSFAMKYSNYRYEDEFYCTVADNWLTCQHAFPC